MEGSSKSQVFISREQGYLLVTLLQRRSIIIRQGLLLIKGEQIEVRRVERHKFTLRVCFKVL